MNSRPEVTAHAETDSHGGIARTRRLLGRLVLLAVMVLLIGQIVVVGVAVTGFEKALEPQLSQKAGVVGRAVSDQIEFVVDELGIPAKNLVGVEPFLDKILESNADIEYLLLLSPSAELEFASGLPGETLQRLLPSLPGPDTQPGARAEVAGFINSVFPIKADGRVVTVLHVGVSGEYVRGRLSDLLYEAITVIVVSLLVTLEILMFLMSTRVAGPLERIDAMLTDGARGLFSNSLVMRARDEIGELIAALNQALRQLRQRYEDFHFDVREVQDAQIDRTVVERIQAACRPVEDRYSFVGGSELRTRNAMQIRVPLFLFMFAEELPRSFLPLFIARLSPADAGISEELLFGLPITLFMLAGMVVVPFGGGLADRFGARRVFLAGVVPATLGYVGTFLAQGYYDFVAWRILSGVGYGLIFISAQAWVAANTGERNRAQGMAVFVGGVFAATICGPSIGGIFADRIGFEATFLISAGLAAISGVLVYVMLDASVDSQSSHGALLGGTEWRRLISDRRLFAVALLAAIPGKLILTGFLFYLVPLYLNELGNRQSVIGWMIMLYGVSTLACMPFAARFADRSGRHATVVAAGGIVAGLGCVASLVDSAVGGPESAVLIAILALGFGHALALTSQIAIVQEVASRYRVIGQASIIGVYRLVERLGMVLGPIVAGGLAASFGYRGAIIGIGVIVVICILLYMIVIYLSRRTPAMRRSELA